MKLILKSNRLVKWPVDVVRSADDGKQETAVLDVTYELISDSERRALLEDAQLSSAVGDTALVKRVVKGIDGLGIEREDGSQIPFDETMLDAVCEHMDVRSALINGFFECASGAIAKNA